MAIGRTFREALGKALRSLENGRHGLDMSLPPDVKNDREELARRVARTGPDRLWELAQAMRLGMTVEEAHQLSHIDPWFLDQLQSVLDAEAELSRGRRPGRGCRRPSWRRYKQLRPQRPAHRRAHRRPARTRRAPRARRPACARSTSGSTPAPPSSRPTRRTSTRRYEEECEARPSDRRKVVILGGGPNRIGQGIEFDYCCVHAVMALREEGFETIMVNCNPETVSTDYDTSDRLYFEPLTLEDVLAICRRREAGGRHRAVRRPDPAQAGGAARAGRRRCCSAPAPTPSTGPRTASASASCSASWACARRAGAWRAALDEAHRVAARDRLPGDGAPVLRAGRPGDGAGLRRRGPRRPTSRAPRSSACRS